MVAIIALGITVDVVSRNLGLGGVGWMLETVEYGLYVLTFTGAAYILRHRRHVAIDFFADSLPRPVRHALAIFSAAVTFAVSANLFFFSCVTTWTAYADHSIIFKSFTIPEWVPLAYLLPTTLVLVIEASRHLVRSFHAPEAAGGPYTERFG
jgi:TRAP-type C4-dicarboxylate transport system permease small subunit